MKRTPLERLRGRFQQPTTRDRRRATLASWQHLHEVLELAMALELKLPDDASRRWRPERWASCGNDYAKVGIDGFDDLVERMVASFIDEAEVKRLKGDILRRYLTKMTHNFGHPLPLDVLYECDDKGFPLLVGRVPDGQHFWAHGHMTAGLLEGIPGEAFELRCNFYTAHYAKPSRRLLATLGELGMRLWQASQNRISPEGVRAAFSNQGTQSTPAGREASVYLSPLPCQMRTSVKQLAQLVRDHFIEVLLVPERTLWQFSGTTIGPGEWDASLDFPLSPDTASSDTVEDAVVVGVGGGVLWLVG